MIGNLELFNALIHINNQITYSKLASQTENSKVTILWHCIKNDLSNFVKCHDPMKSRIFEVIDELDYEDLTM